MSLNNIELKPQMLADLYGNALIEMNATSMPDSDLPNFLGGYDKQILIVVSHMDVPVIPEQDLNLLGSILTACHLSLADVAVINFKMVAPKNFEKLHREAKTVLLFAVDPLSTGLPINFPFFQLQHFDRRKYLYAPALSGLGSDKVLKTKLWNALKNLFVI